MESEERLVEVCHQLRDSGYDDILIVVRSTSMNQLRVVGTDSMVKASKPHIAPIIKCEAALSLSGVGKELNTCLFGPPALPDCLDRMRLSSLTSYCRQLVRFEKAMNPDLSEAPAWAPPEPIGTSATHLLEDHFRAAVLAFFSHHALSVKKNTVFATETIARRRFSGQYDVKMSLAPMNAASINATPTNEASTNAATTYAASTNALTTSSFNSTSQLVRRSNAINRQAQAPPASRAAPPPLRLKSEASEFDDDDDDDDELEDRVDDLSDSIDDIIDDGGNDDLARGGAADAVVESNSLKRCFVSLNRLDYDRPAPKKRRSLEEPRIDAGETEALSGVVDERGKEVVVVVKEENSDGVEYVSRDVRGGDDWPPLPRPVEQMKMEILPYINTVVSHLIKRNFSFDLAGNNPEVTAEATNLLPAWVSRLDLVPTFSWKDQKRVVKHLIKTYAPKGKVAVDPLGLELRRVESFLPAEAEMKSSKGGSYLDRFLEYFERKKRLLARPCLGVIQNVRGSSYADVLSYCSFVRWSVKTIVGCEGDRFLRCVENVVAAEPSKESGGGKKRAAIAKVNHVAKTLTGETTFLDPRDVTDLTVLYRFRYAAEKIGHVGFTVKGFDDRWRSREALRPKVTWPKTTRSLAEMNPEQTRVYLLRVIAYLDEHRGDWREAVLGGDSTLDPNPYENDHAANVTILDRLRETFQRDFAEGATDTPWPCLPKSLEDMDFVDVAMYVQLLVIHLSGYRPNLGDPKDKPWYWGEVWGLPSNATTVGEWNEEWKTILGLEELSGCPVARWVDFQKRMVIRVANEYAPASWSEQNPSRYKLFSEQYFPFVGKFVHYDLRAMSRFKMYARPDPNAASDDESLLWTEVSASFPHLAVQLPEFALTMNNLRGFVVELTLHLLGHVPLWKDKLARPEFWPNSLDWDHPFSSTFEDADVLLLFVDLISKFGPDTVDASPSEIDGKDYGYDGAQEPKNPRVDNQRIHALDATPLGRDALISLIRPFCSRGRFTEAEHRTADLNKIAVKEAVVDAREPRSAETVPPNTNARRSRVANKGKKKKRRKIFNGGAKNDPELPRNTERPEETPKASRWPALPCPLNKLGSKKYIHDYLSCLVKSLLNNDAPQFTNARARPSFWPAWASWTTPDRIGAVESRRIIFELMEKLGVEATAIPVDPYEYECRKASVNFSPRLKKCLNFPSNVNLVKKLMSLFPENEYLLCGIPRLRAPVQNSLSLDLRLFLSSLYIQLVSLLGEAVMLPFRDEMALCAQTDSWPENVKKYLRFFGLRPEISKDKALIGYSLLRLKRFAQRTGHMIRAAQPDVSTCKKWPVSPRPLVALCDHGMANYLTRLVIFLGGKLPDWSRPSELDAWPDWAQWKDPRFCEKDWNRKIVLHIMDYYGITDESGDERITFWPPLPKPMDRLDFADVVGYVSVLVYHLEGVKPDLSRRDHKPDFWHGEWGLPEKFDLGIDPKWAVSWVAGQRLALQSIFQKYGPEGGVGVDMTGYLPHYFRCFPFIGRYGDIDRLAETRLLNSNLVNDGKKVALQHWPKVDVSKKYVSETSLRGYLVEVMRLLCGQHARWDRSDHRPEFWPPSVAWQHPFAVAFSLADVLRAIAHCVKLFGPEYIGFTHENDYISLMEEEFGSLEELKKQAANLAIKREEFVLQCDAMAEELSATTNGKFAMAFDNVVCRLCSSKRKGKQSVLACVLKHMQESHGETAICEICCKTFQSVTRLKRHRELSHLKSKERPCKICGKVISSQMSKHMLMHGPKTLQCPQCPKMFRHLGNLQIHEKYHLKVRPFSCNVCNRGFARKSHWQRHLLSHKNGIEIK